MILSIVSYTFHFLILPHMTLDVDTILAELHHCTDEKQLQSFHATYLGKKWSISWQFKILWSLSPDERKEQGKKIKQLFDTVEKAFHQHQDICKQRLRDEKLQHELVDSSVPVAPLDTWHLNLLSQTRRRVETIFQSLWFHIAYGHDMVNQRENFSSVNIPPTHPATEMHDTLYVQWVGSEKAALWEKQLLRTHTSAHQIELIKKYGVPSKFVVPGKVYRNEKMDASHDCVFRQIEWVVIDKNISIAHFKSMMKQLLSAILEQDVEMRFRPAYFPFVEPGFEIDAKATVGNSEKRLEILWAGMIHPEVLKNAWVDPNEYSGFAFGLWLTRLVAIRYGLHDIRLLTNNDLRFVRSF